jgi:hypothetical protein
MCRNVLQSDECEHAGIGGSFKRGRSRSVLQRGVFIQLREKIKWSILKVSIISACVTVVLVRLLW